MTNFDLPAFLDKPQGYIAMLIELDRTRSFAIIPELIEELEAADLAQEDRKRLSQGILSLTAEWYCQRIPAHRRDWLYAEYLALFIINSLYWVARLETKQTAVSENRDETLASFLSPFAGDSFLEAALEAPDQKGQIDQLVALLLATISYLRVQYGEFEVAGEGMLTELAKDPQRIRFWPPEIATVETRCEMLDRIAAAVAKWPQCLGAILVGSFAAEYKWDEYGDLDMCCLCTEKPDADVHTAIVEAIAPTNHDAYGSHLYLDFGATSMHLEFAVQADQDRYFKQLREKGTEEPFINVSHADYALSAYGWTSGRVLHDPSGILSAYQQSVALFPEEMRRVQTDYWRSVWRTASASYEWARGTHDRVSSLSALHFCCEAAIRMLMIRHEIYGNPHSPKWLPRELANLPSQKKEQVGDLLALAQAVDPMGPLEKRFEQVAVLWQLVA